MNRSRKKAEASADRLPPHSPEAERSALGCLLLEPDECWNTAQEAGLALEWFYDLRHATIYNAMAELTAAGKDVDAVTLVTWLSDRGLIEQVGGLAYVAALPEAPPSSSNLPSYLDILREKFMGREVLKSCTEASVAIFEHEGGSEVVLHELEKQILRLSEERLDQRERRLKDLIPDLLAELEDYHRGRAQIRGLTTGLEYVDKLLCGLGGKHGNYIVIAGRPATGKTSLATQIALHAALDFTWFEPVIASGIPVMETTADGQRPQMAPRRGVPVAIFTMEMAANALVHRMLFQRARADMQRWRTGFAVAEDFPPIVRAAAELNKCEHLLVDDTGRCTIDSLKAKARRMHRQNGIKLFIIDYIQLLRAGGRRFRDDRVQELSEISGELQNLGKELQVPFIVLAQMNRDYEKDPNRPPRLSDLKDCGSIEQDADLVGFLYSSKKAHDEPEYVAAMNAVYGTDWSKVPIRVDCLWAKNRYGPGGNSQLLFQRSSTIFHDWNRWRKDHGQKEPAAGEPKFDRTVADYLPNNDELKL